jgi:predicted RNA-binding Zn ribbon-like protein
VTETAGAADFRRGAGRLSLDFVRTLRNRGTAAAVEELPDASALAAWVAQFGPFPARPGAGQEHGAAGQAVTARRLREAVYQLIIAARGPGGAGSCPQAARQTVNEAASHPGPAPHLDASGLLRWEAGDPVSATLALIARDALDLAASAAIARVRDCANPSCNAMFLDGSRPGSRRWCSMSTCGNQAKKTNLRSKRTSAPSVG